MAVALFLVSCNKEETKKESDAVKEIQPAQAKTDETPAAKQTTDETKTEESKATTVTDDEDDESDQEDADDVGTNEVDESETNTTTANGEQVTNLTSEVKAEEKIAGCTDSDNGKDYNVMGTVTLKNGYKESDQCSTNTNTPNKLYEKYCKGDTYLTEGYTCEYGCMAGACVADDDETNVEEQPTNSTQ